MKRKKKIEKEEAEKGRKQRQSVAERLGESCRKACAGRTARGPHIIKSNNSRRFLFLSPPFHYEMERPASYFFFEEFFFLAIH